MLLQTAGYNDSVFINCPFDDEYLPILRAVVFALYRCGFLPNTALNQDNGLDNRLGKIERCIEGCRYGIHDISRIELNTNDLPRFNMPFELGLFFGARRFGSQRHRQKNAIIFDAERYRYQEFISDLNGVDIKAHGNDPLIAIRKLRDWLLSASRRTTIPDYALLARDYRQFESELPAKVLLLDVDIEDLSFNDYCLIVEEYLRVNI